MTRARMLLVRVLGVFRRGRSEQDLADELQFHLEHEVERLTAQGMSPEEARHAARRRFGGLDRAKEAYRDARGLPWVEEFFRDLRYAIRMLRRSRGFTAVAVLSLALGIGANTAIFSLFDAVLLRQMPAPEPDRLVILARSPQGDRLPRAWTEELLADTRIFESGFMQGSTSLVTVQVGRAEDDARAALVGGAFYRVLGLRPAAGRLLTPSDDRPGAPPVAVISYRYWQRRFALDPQAIGSTFTLNRQATPSVPPVATVFTIIGVAPRDFYGTQAGWDPELTVPLARQAQVTTLPTYLPVDAMARLQPGVSRVRAEAEGDAIIRPFAEQEQARRNSAAPDRLALLPGAAGFHALDLDRFTRPLEILLAVVGLVLLLACANLSSLLLARAVGRQREVAVRSAVGAGRGRLIRQFLTESFLLTLLGGAAGVVLAWWLSPVLVAAMTAGTPLVLPLTPDGRVLGFTAAAMLGTALLVGLAPALRAARTDVTAGLKEVRTGGRWRTGRALVTAQVSISMLLVVAASLFIGTLIRLYSVDKGFDAGGVLTFEVSTLHPDVRALLARLESVPNVRSASAANELPFPVGGLGQSSGTRLLGLPERDDLDVAAQRVRMIWAAPRFFETQGMPLLAGRSFRAGDEAGKEVILSQTMVRRYFDGVPPLGRVLDVGEVVGIVGDTKAANLRDNAPAMFYAPLPATRVVLWGWEKAPAYYYYLARVEQGDPLRMAPAIEAALREVHPDLRLRNVATEEELIDQTLVNERMLAALAGFFGAVALLLAGIGVYGVLSFHVTQRTNEFGVRMALGADRASIRSMVLRDVGIVLAVGLAIGAAGAAGLSQLAATFLFGFTPTDPRAFGLAAAVLAAAVVLAAWLPALRASHVDPMVALRHE